MSIKVYYISDYINDQAIYECIDFFYFQPVFPVKLRRKSIHKLFRTIDKWYKTGNLFPSDTIIFPIEEAPIVTSIEIFYKKISKQFYKECLLNENIRIKF